MEDLTLLFGNYLAREPLARGGFGQVYRGEHRYLSQRIVAIKVMRDAPLQTQEEREAFLREANLLELLKHPSILPLLDVGVQENVPYLVTEYAPAGSLRQRLHTLRGQFLPLDEALHILSQIAAALH
ncbi:MAG: protein kinase, partial [Ktedonobacteraceae bacterium]